MHSFYGSRFECQVNMIKSFEKGGVLVLITTFVALDRL